MEESDAQDDGRDCLLRFVDVHKQYGEDVIALRGMNLDVYPGEFLTLLGPSGGGKSTALMMLAGFDTPTSGDILYKGQSLADIGDKACFFVLAEFFHTRFTGAYHP